MLGLAEPSVTSQLAEWVGEDPRRCYWRRRTTCQGLEQHMWAEKSLHMDGETFTSHPPPPFIFGHDTHHMGILVPQLGIKPVPQPWMP